MCAFLKQRAPALAVLRFAFASCCAGQAAAPAPTMAPTRHPSAQQKADAAAAADAATPDEILSSGQRWLLENDTAPFRALWNQPWTEECAQHYNSSAGMVNVSAFGGISANPDFVCRNASWGCPIGSRSGPLFNGPVVATLYPEPTWADGTGLYPQFTCAGPIYSEKTCTAVNGGSPMLANLTAHLEQWRLDIDRLFPDPDCTAVIALDWEAWWPLWGSNEPDYNGTHYYVYGQVARRLAREQNPGLGKVAIEAKAKQGWEATCKQWLVSTIRLAQTARPKATWGFYNMPGETGEGSTNQLDYLWDAVDALFPSIYTNYPDSASNIAYVQKIMSEARRVAARADGTVRPIYAYTMPEYEDEGWSPRPKVPEFKFLAPPDFLAEFELSAQYGLAGLILYGGSADGYTKARCDVVRAYMNGTFLPQIAAIVAERNVCAAAHCSNHGTCIDHPGAVPPYCACVKGWRGTDCSIRHPALVGRSSPSVQPLPSAAADFAVVGQGQCRSARGEVMNGRSSRAPESESACADACLSLDGRNRTMLCVGYDWDEKGTSHRCFIFGCGLDVEPPFTPGGPWSQWSPWTGAGVTIGGSTGNPQATAVCSARAPWSPPSHLPGHQEATTAQFVAVGPGRCASPTGATLSGRSTRQLESDSACSEACAKLDGKSQNTLCVGYDFEPPRPDGGGGFCWIWGCGLADWPVITPGGPWSAWTPWQGSGLTIAGSTGAGTMTCMARAPWSPHDSTSLKTDDDSSSKHLLVDMHDLESVTGATFTMNPPTCDRTPVLEPDAPWEVAANLSLNVYHSVVAKPDGTLQLWYNILNDSNTKTGQPFLVGFAESANGGKSFSKPILNQYSLNGSTANNIIGPGLSTPMHEGCSVWLDGTASLGAQYVSQAKCAEGCSGLGFATSYDGRVWNQSGAWAAGSGGCDTQSNVFADPWTGQFRLYTRNWVRTSPEYRTIRQLSCPKGKLSPASVSSCWSDQHIVMQPDSIDRCHIGETCKPAVQSALDYYGGVIWPYTSSVSALYFMFTERTWHWVPKSEKEWNDDVSMPGPAMIDVGLAVSRDGINFTHVGSREPFIGPGLEETFDSKFQWLLPYPVAGSNEIHYFYAGTNTDHDGKVDGKTKRSGIGMCRGRLDGLVSLNSPLHPPSGNVSVAITKPIVISGTNLVLNLDTGAGGVIRVEVLNTTTNTPLPLFSDSVIDKGVFTVNHENTIPIVSNSVAKVVQWHTLMHVSGKHVWKQYGLEALHGQHVKLRFLMTGTKLYSYSLKTDDVGFSGDRSPLKSDNAPPRALHTGLSLGCKHDDATSLSLLSLELSASTPGTFTIMLNNIPQFSHSPTNIPQFSHSPTNIPQFSHSPTNIPQFSHSTDACTPQVTTPLKMDDNGSSKRARPHTGPLRMLPLGVYCGGGGATDSLSENCEETTPFMWHNRLAVVEHHHPFRVRWQSHAGLPANVTAGNNSAICASIPGTNWMQYASAIVVGQTLWIFGTNDVVASPPAPNGKQRTQVWAFWSEDPALSAASWHTTRIIQMPQNGSTPGDPNTPLPWWTAYNTGPTKGMLAGVDAYFLAIELDTPQSIVPVSKQLGEGYLSVFAICRQCAETDDLSFGWEVLDPLYHVYRRDRYSACPTLRWYDGWFYIIVLYSHVRNPAGPHCASASRNHGISDGCLVQHIARSQDLVRWEESPTTGGK